MRFRPCIDLHQGKVKQIVGSSLTDNNDRLVTNFETELPPSHYASIYKGDNFPGGHVIMLGPGNEDAAVGALGAFPGGLHIGGGITSENAPFYLDAGASHVIVTSYVFEDAKVHRDRLDALVKTIGKARLVLDLSCKCIDGVYWIVTDRWQKISDVSITVETLEDLSKYCDEFLVHAAHVEGLQKGIDQELVALLAEKSPITATYAGGVRSIEDLELIYKKGDGRVDITIGSALDLFGGSLKYDDVVEFFGKIAE